MTKKFYSVSAVAAALVVAGCVSVGNAYAADTFPPVNPINDDVTVTGENEVAQTLQFSTTRGTRTISGATNVAKDNIIKQNATPAANPYGSVIYADNIYTLVVKDLTLTGGNVGETSELWNQGGAGLHAGWDNTLNQGSKSITVTNVVVDKNKAAVAAAGANVQSLSGGGVYLHGTELATLTNVKITGNELDVTKSTNTSGASAYGGGFYSFGSDKVEFLGTANEISGNSATSKAYAFGGGAAFADNAGAWERTINVTNTLVSKNEVKSEATQSSISGSTGYGWAYGGGVYVLSSLTGSGTNDFTKVKFEENTITTKGGFAHGGGAYVSENGLTGNAVTTFTGCDFVGNTATSILADTTGGTARGGGAYVRMQQTSNKPVVTFTDTSFTGNSAIVGTSGTAQGGAIWAGSDITIKADQKDVTFSGNTTKVGTVETANDIYLANNAKLTLNAATDKTITLGGGVKNVGSDIDITGAGTVTFGSGSVTSIAGTITLDNSVGSVTFEDNSVSEAGALVLKAGNVTLAAGSELTLADNSGSGGGDGSITVTDGTLTNAGTLTAVDVSVDSTGAMILAAGSTNTISGDIGVSGAFTIGSELAISTGQAFTVDSTGTLTVDSTGTLTVDSTGTLTVDGALNSGMYYLDGNDWTSNVKTTNDAEVSFGNKATWFIQEAVGYTGGEVVGMPTIGDDNIGAANAALTKGNERTQLYDFLYDGETITSDPKDKANINDTIVNAPLMFLPNAMGTAVAGRVQQQFALQSYAGSGVYRGQECEPCDRAIGHIGRISPMGPISFWTNYIGRSTELVSSNSTIGLNGMSKITSDGVQFGIDRLIGKRTVVGAMFNYERALSVLNASRMTGDNYGFAFYGAHQFRTGVDALAMFGYGHQKYESRRWDIGNLVVQNANFTGNTFEMTLEAGRRFRMNQSLWLRPAVALDVYNNGIESFDEAGAGTAAGALSFGQTSLTQAFVRVGGDAIVKRGRFVGNGGFYYSHQMSENGNQVTTMASGVKAFGSDLGRNKLTFNLGGSYALGQRKALNAFGGYSGDYFTDRAGTPWGHNGYVGARYQF